MSSLSIEQFPCLSDNYGFLLHDEKSGDTAAIDTPDAAAILHACERRQWNLTHIFNTHHHFDHTGGNGELKSKTNCQIIGPEGEAERIPHLDTAVKEGDTVCLGSHSAQVLEVGGHTHGHIAYYFREQDCAFVGDTLFALGCGRLFEGTPTQMWESLSKLMRLPETTALYCAHEYTAANARFAIHVDANNQALQQRVKDITERREKNLPTVPTQVALEKKTNPFVRPHDKAIRNFLHMENASDVNVFAELRRLKDNF